MLKRFLMILGILLLLGIAAVGVRIFIDRRNHKMFIGTETTTKQPVALKNKATVKPSFDKSAHSIDNPTSIWVVVNKRRPLKPLEYAPSDLTAVGNNQQMRKEAADALAQLIAGAKAQNMTIQPISGYRSYSYQVTVYGKEVTDKGQAVADTESARPGHSEHQTGWTIDVGNGNCGIDECFGNTAEGKWLASNAYQYGFIVRYTSDKVAITGYRAEPWHIRYIGTELANEMHTKNITTLEEFFGLPAAPDYQ